MFLKCGSVFLSEAPGTPSHVVFSEVTGSSLNVSWGAPLQPNGVVEGYRVVYEPTAPVHGEHDTRKSKRKHAVKSLFKLKRTKKSLELNVFSLEYRYMLFNIHKVP